MPAQPKLLIVHDQAVFSKVDEARRSIREQGTYTMRRGPNDVKIELGDSMLYVLTVRDRRQRTITRIQGLSEERALLDLMSFQEEALG